MSQEQKVSIAIFFLCGLLFGLSLANMWYNFQSSYAATGLVFSLFGAVFFAPFAFADTTSTTNQNNTDTTK